MANESTREYDQRAEKAGGMTGKVLTPAEVASLKMLASCDLCDSHEALREGLLRALRSIMEWENKEAAICPEDVGFPEFIGSLQNENARLRGLIDGMECEFDCESYVRQSECTGYGKCNCIRSKVNL